MQQALRARMQVKWTDESDTFGIKMLIAGAKTHEIVKAMRVEFGFTCTADAIMERIRKVRDDSQNSVPWPDASCFIPISEAVRDFGVLKQSLLAHIRSGKIRAIRESNHWLVDMVYVDIYLEARAGKRQVDWELFDKLVEEMNTYDPNLDLFAESQSE